jgi:hypothetical protein
MTKDEALEKSIHKWERIVADRRAVDNQGGNCALCLQSGGDCSRCLVGLKTGSIECYETPYWDWVCHQVVKHKECEPYRRQKDCKECTMLAQAELDFLISLRD